MDESFNAVSLVVTALALLVSFLSFFFFYIKMPIAPTVIMKNTVMPTLFLSIMDITTPPAPIKSPYRAINPSIES